MIETKIQEEYQIKIPKEIYNTLNIKTDDKLIWNIKEDEIIIKIKNEKKLKNKQISFIDDEEIESIIIEK
ncbi:hypothetical protein PXD04_01560 [Methanosphaera sp. ISO3-F5]|uniref:AbrB/MazE/SpoVT family DNA-binding domain-containing protein n=1 Tax=Methanosphaera sp. ISO3-F5 TaxID=1452353 RepID=UPI002B25FB95|nr:hypothetical protein [Methanosphaera sp. ISO3-F5]WQH64506.1 hypothetical protein PXD04_01560 [Methanosphaera sp. ISO3-F5]